MFSQKYTAKDYHNHLKRVQKILNHKNNDYSSHRKQFLKKKHISSMYSKKQQHLSIGRSNQKLKNRLIQIGTRKVQKMQHIIKPWHCSYREQQLRRIRDQNNSLAQRLLSKKSEFSQTKVKRDVKNYNSMRKVLFRNKSAQRNSHHIKIKLPKIQSNLTELKLTTLQT